MILKKLIHNLIKDNEKAISCYGVARLGLFGSTVREQEKESSDIDMLVEFMPGKKNYDNFIELCFFLEDTLGRKIDLLTPEGISPSIKKRIDKEIEYVQIIY